MHFYAAQLFITMELLEWNGLVVLTWDCCGTSTRCGVGYIKAADCIVPEKSNVLNVKCVHPAFCRAQ